MSSGLSLRALIVRDALIEAGEAAHAAWSVEMGVSTKADGTPVTASDLTAEAVIVAALQRAFPEDAVITEESGGEAGGAAWWVVDPIDGTSSFIEGLGHWGPTVARITPGRAGPEIDCGALYLPRLGEHYHVEARGPARGGFFNGAPMPQFTERPSQRTVYLPSRFHTYFRLRYRGKTRCIGGTAAHLALVARGAAEAVIVASGWATWDTAAGLALIDVLGGRAALLRTGAPLNPFDHEGQAFVAGNPEIVEEFLRAGAITPLPEEP